MAKNKPIPKCRLSGCKNPCRPVNGYWDRFCGIHSTKATLARFLSRCYTKMGRRVKGKDTKRPDLYLGLSILPRDVFITWSKNHPDFLSLYKRWFTNDFDRKLTPTVNRMNSNKGYVLGNIEWMTNSQNCGLAGSVKSMKQKQAIYKLLGINH